MHRNLIIILCVTNACIATGLMWFVFGPKSKPSITNKASTSLGTEIMTDEAHWQHATKATSLREAAFHLSQFKDQDELNIRTSELIYGLHFDSVPNLNKWPLYQASMQAHGKNADTASELKLLAKIAQKTQQALTLRDTAFRVYIENWLRIESDDKVNEETFELIDTLYHENNSLADTSLEAEYFLIKNNASTAERNAQFKDRLRNTAMESSRAATTRITALKTLSELGALLDLPMENIYHSASTHLQTAILRVLENQSSSKASKEQWLRLIQPTTSEQEQLLLRILKTMNPQ